MTPRDNETISLSALFWGLLLGLIVGGVTALFKAPVSGRDFRQQVSEQVSATSHNLRSTVESVVPSDPVAESLAAGKEAARRRRSDYGMLE